MGRHRRHVHAPLQHRPHGSDARRVPREAAGARRAAGRRVRRRGVRGDVLPGRARPVALLRGAVGPDRPPQGDALRPRLRRRRGDPHRVHHEPAAARRHALARRRLDRGERPLDPRLHRDGDRQRPGAPRTRRSPLRGRDAARAGGRDRRCAGPVRRDRPDGVPAQCRSSTASRSSSTGGASRTPPGKRRRSRASTAACAATASCCGARTSGCSPPPGSRSTRRSACGSTSRSSS